MTKVTFGHHVQAPSAPNNLSCPITHHTPLCLLCLRNAQLPANWMLLCLTWPCPCWSLCLWHLLLPHYLTNLFICLDSYSLGSHFWTSRSFCTIPPQHLPPGQPLSPNTTIIWARVFLSRLKAPQGTCSPATSYSPVSVHPPLAWSLAHSWGL